MLVSGKLSRLLSKSWQLSRLLSKSWPLSRLLSKSWLLSRLLSKPWLVKATVQGKGLLVQVMSACQWQVVKLLVNGKLSKQELLVKGKATAQVMAAVQVNGKLSELRLMLLNGKLSKSGLLLVNDKAACQWQVKGMATCQWLLVQAASQWQAVQGTT